MYHRRYNYCLLSLLTGLLFLIDQQRKLNDIIHICQLGVGSIDVSFPTSETAVQAVEADVDFSTLLQMIILLQRDGVLSKVVLGKEIDAVQKAFCKAITHGHDTYKTSMKTALQRKDYDQLIKLVQRMRSGRLDLVYAMRYGCYRESGWAGAVNRAMRNSEQASSCTNIDFPVPVIRLVVGDVWARTRPPADKFLQRIRSSSRFRRAALFPLGDV